MPGCEHQWSVYEAHRACDACGEVVDYGQCEGCRNLGGDAARLRRTLGQVATLATRWSKVDGRYAGRFTPHGLAILRILEDNGIDPAELEAKPCEHGRPDYRMCPHCIGIGL